ncbi:hypothetical protein GCM10011352_19380 [Marinobacterium zhoushanense]|uniref:TIR domain-containing protein n=1 Tax=Marinobacterium zhoushanense TaxID=1679163 RepID=A0ABQ1KAL9_9GAMM|nr:TIR domain-containing protein [Marinobacterium zhoushanense]GGB93432.1 hypothetical protein GCM10011352_19380 [Marinobacterium zhoushanense]
MQVKYDIALFFAGEDRAYVEMVAEQLKARGISVFYDFYEEENLWGKDLYVHLTDLYRKQAKFTLMFISKNYANKLWTNLERKAAQSRAFEESSEYILPARFDDTEIPGVLSTTGFIDLRKKSPVEVAVMVGKKLGVNPFEVKSHSVPPPKNELLIGRAKFDYSNNNGLFRIGSGAFEFSSRWSKASNTSIHCYTDTPNIRGVALAPKDSELENLDSVSIFDYTSRVRKPEIGRYVILQNTNGIYAALKIISIKDDSRGDEYDELVFDYWIQKSGSDSFVEYASRA